MPFLLPLLVHYPIQSNTMDTNPLTRVEIWHLENVLFKLYRTIQSCVDSIDPGLINLFDFSDSMTWIDKDTLITEFFENRNIMNMEDLQSLNSQKKILSDFGTSS